MQLALYLEAPAEPWLHSWRSVAFQSRKFHDFVPSGIIEALLSVTSDAAALILQQLRFDTPEWAPPTGKGARLAGMLHFLPPAADVAIVRSCTQYGEARPPELHMCTMPPALVHRALAALQHEQSSAAADLHVGLGAQATQHHALAALCAAADVAHGAVPLQLTIAHDEPMIAKHESRAAMKALADAAPRLVALRLQDGLQQEPDCRFWFADSLRTCSALTRLALCAGPSFAAPGRRLKHRIRQLADTVSARAVRAGEHARRQEVLKQALTALSKESGLPVLQHLVELQIEIPGCQHIAERMVATCRELRRLRVACNAHPQLTRLAALAGSQVTSLTLGDSVTLQSWQQLAAATQAGQCQQLQHLDLRAASCHADVANAAMLPSSSMVALPALTQLRLHGGPDWSVLGALRQAAQLFGLVELHVCSGTLSKSGAYCTAACWGNCGPVSRCCHCVCRPGSTGAVTGLQPRVLNWCVRRAI